MNQKPQLIFGTRGSALARYQTALVAEKLQHIFTDLNILTTTFSTRGDKELDKPLPEIGGKGLFTAELEAALRHQTIDLAVHSLKDLPTEDSLGLTIGAILARENPADVIVSRRGYTMDTLPRGASVGTSSLRRKAQLLAYRPDLNVIPLRGNVDTRIRKALDANGPYDAIILAAAGLKRVGLDDHISQQIPFELMLPAPGQGAIAVQCRADDAVTLAKLARLNHLATYQAVSAERAFLTALGGGCSIPVGALGQIADDTISLQGVIADPAGKQVIRVNDRGPAVEAEALGQAMAQRALIQGARDILEVAHV